MIGWRETSLGTVPRLSSPPTTHQQFCRLVLVAFTMAHCPRAFMLNIYCPDHCSFTPTPLGRVRTVGGTSSFSSCFIAGRNSDQGCQPSLPISHQLYRPLSLLFLVVELVDQSKAFITSSPLKTAQLPAPLSSSH